MTLFWLAAAALAAVTLLLVLRPLLRRREGEGVSREGVNLAIHRDQLRELDADLAAGTLAQADYERSRRELEARLLEDVSGEEKQQKRGGRAAIIVVGLAIPACALALYVLVGNPGAFTEDQHVGRMVERLAAHLRENPDDANGWKLLGRSYATLGRYPEAADAYARAAVRSPRDAELLVDFADALGMARGRSLQGEPEKLVLRALELEPANLKALALAGTAAFERREFGAAAGYWERMLPRVEAGSEDARVIRENVAEAKRLAASPVLRGKVAVSPKLRDRLRPDDTVFILARAVEGPPVPLAVMKARASELPLSFSLDDSMAMAPGMTLSAHPRVVVVARVSRSGQAASQSGDMQGMSRSVPHDAKSVTILIDTVIR